MMTGWFEWNGVRCTEKGIYVSELPAIVTPMERIETKTVPGRSGTVTIRQGEDIYEDIVLSAECWIQSPDAIPEIAGWLKGEGRLTFANRAGGHYLARLNNQISFAQILRGRPHRRFALSFRAKPFWYVDDERNVTIAASGGSVYNSGTVIAKPKITVYGNGDITLMIAGQMVELKGVSNYVELDSEAEEAITAVGGVAQVIGEFPGLKCGTNGVSWTGNVSRMVVERRTRYL